MGSVKGFFSSGRRKDEYRPRLEISRTPLETVLDIISVLGFFALIFIVAYYWGRLPETIPTHFDMNGQANGWGSRSTILILPITGVLTAIILQVLCFFPHTYNYLVKITPENAVVQYRLGRTLMKYISAVILGVFAYLQWTTVQAALNVQNAASSDAIIEIVLINAAFLGPILVYFLLSSKYK